MMHAVGERVLYESVACRDRSLHMYMRMSVCIRDFSFMQYILAALEQWRTKMLRLAFERFNAKSFIVCTIRLFELL